MPRTLLLLTMLIAILAAAGCTQRNSDPGQDRQGSFYGGVSGGKTW